MGWSRCRRISLNRNTKLPFLYCVHLVRTELVVDEDVPDPPVPGFPSGRLDLVAQELAGWILNPLAFLVHRIAESSRPYNIEELGLGELVLDRGLDSNIVIEVIIIVIVITLRRVTYLHWVTQEMVQVDGTNDWWIRWGDQVLGSRDEQTVWPFDIQNELPKLVLDGDVFELLKLGALDPVTDQVSVRVRDPFIVFVRGIEQDHGFFDFEVSLPEPI